MADPGRPDAAAPEPDSVLVARLRDLDLTETVAALAQVATGAQPFTASLDRIVALAVSVVPGADGASIVVVDAQHPDTSVASDDLTRRVHAITEGAGEGPWLTAVSEGVAVSSGALETDTRWPRFGPRAQSLGAQSVLAAPLVFGGEVLGSLDVYARRRHAFDARATAIGETFAVAAAVTVLNARRVVQAERLAEQLQTALTSRAVIDQAIGILMSRQGGTADDAFERLRQLSQHQNTKLQAVAQGLVDDAVSRARARHAGGH